MADRFLTRRERLSRLIARGGVEWLLVTGETNVRYLTGFSGDSTWLFVGPGQAIAVSDERYRVQLDEECPGLDAFIRPPGIKISDAAVKIARREKLSRIGVEAHLMPVELLQTLQGELPSVEFVSTSGLIETELRAIKDAGEIAEIREAVRLAIRGFEFLKALLTSDLTEQQASFELEHALRRMGAERFSFPAIIAGGDRAALPHYRPTARRIGDASLLLVDWGAERASLYKSDLTRTLFLGKPTAKFEKVYSTVLAAQQAAIAAIRAGAICGEIDRIARDVISKAGFGKRFGHSLGHGLGLEVHEQPRLAPNSDTRLRAGMVVTVEPGIYLPGWGGVRIEDDVLVTPGGCEVLSDSLSKSLADMLLSL